MSRNPAVEDYWLRHYTSNHCTLCGNTGVIDTRGVRTNAGFPTGRLNWCICPNGQILRDALGNDNAEEMLRRVRGAIGGPVKAITEQWAAEYQQRQPPTPLLELTEGPLQPEEFVPWRGYAYGWPDGRPRPYPTSKELRAGVPTCDGKNGTCKCWGCVHGIVLQASKGPGSADR